MKKILYILFSGILIVGLGLAICWTVINFNKVEDGLSGAGIYTEEDLNNSYNDGYNTALSDKEEYVKLINQYRDEITTLNEKISKLTVSNTTKILEVQALTIQRNTLSSQLSNVAEENVKLNEKINTLNIKINELLKQIEDNNSLSLSLNDTIKKLQDTITYYEDYIKTLENDSTCVATFKYDGYVINVQTATKGSLVQVVVPEDTNKIKFVGWLVDGNLVDLSTYVLNQNTEFVADLIYSYDVKFFIDDSEYSTQIIENGAFATCPEEPIKEGYAFKGWSINDEIVSIDSFSITKDTVFIAKFEKLFTVSYIVDNTVISTSTVEDGAVSSVPSDPSKEKCSFFGWYVNNVKVNPEEYQIFEDTNFVAKFNYSIDYYLYSSSSWVSQEFDNNMTTDYQYTRIRFYDSKITKNGLSNDLTVIFKIQRYSARSVTEYATYGFIIPKNTIKGSATITVPTVRYTLQEVPIRVDLVFNYEFSDGCLYLENCLELGTNAVEGMGISLEELPTNAGIYTPYCFLKYIYFKGSTII